MTLSNEPLARTIERRIAEYLASDDPRLEWTKAKVSEHGFLPVYLGSPR